MIPFPFKDTGGKVFLRDLTKALASVILQADVKIRRLLNNLYIIAGNKPEDYGELNYLGDLPYKKAQAYGEYLDRLGYMFNVKRRLFENDEYYRQRIIFFDQDQHNDQWLETDDALHVLENSPIFDLKGTTFEVEIRESYKDNFDGITSGLNSPLRDKASLLYGIIVYIRPVKTNTRNVNYKGLINYSDSPSFRVFLDAVTAAGIRVDRVVFLQRGAGGNRGERYAYSVEDRR